MKTEVSTGFLLRYSFFLAELDQTLDAGGDLPAPAEYEDMFAYAIDDLALDAREEGEFEFILPMLEFLLSRVGQPIKDLRSKWISHFIDLFFPGSGSLCSVPDPEWTAIFELARQRLFGPLLPLTEADKARIRSETTLTDESLEDFRTRMRAEGRMPKLAD